MAKMPGQHSIVYAANVDGVLACSTEHKDNCQMVLQTLRYDAYTYRAMGYFLADDGRKYIYIGGTYYIKTVDTEVVHSRALWISA
jgi:hypothetical protein